ncbi:unnamed protein product [Linum tenue]|uniref:Uncharacterized protein n=1 Tax=Linum tenue TaxID=586396 RepID=A0AAV0REE6_9ROSI|nr:unnamed protein product [Linum tenue]
MFDFGDELTLQSYRIPWLIWIQILVLLLIVFLFYCFSFSITSPDDEASILSSSVAASADSASSSYSRDSDDTKKIAKHGGGDDSKTVADYVRHCQVTRSQSIKGELAMTTTTTGRRIVSEDTVEGDAVTNYHPCNYIRLAKLVFLKCFGLDCEFERSSSSEKKKRR